MTKLDDVWRSRDYPVLLEVTQRIDRDGGPVMVAQLQEQTGIPREQILAAGFALARRGLVEISARTYGRGGFSAFLNVSGSAYLMTGLHPDGDDALSQLISALRQAADTISDEDERSNLRKAADLLAGGSRQVAAGVLTAVLTRYATGA